MKKSFSESPVGKFLLGKGFYAALAVCVLGAGAAAWVIVDKTIDSFTGQPPAVSGTTLQNTASSAPASQKEQQVEQKVSNVSRPSSLLLQCAFLLFGAGSVFRGFRRIRTGYHFSKLRRILLYASR